MNDQKRERNERIAVFLGWRKCPNHPLELWFTPFGFRANFPDFTNDELRTGLMIVEALLKMECDVNFYHQNSKGETGKGYRCWLNPALYHNIEGVGDTGHKALIAAIEEWIDAQTI